jgi:signal transduction histidine kinase
VTAAKLIERLKTEFVATVSHELRTPLTSISGALGLLINDAGGTLPVQAKRLLTIAHANSQRLVRLVNNILDMERIESGKVVFVQKRLEIRSLVEEAIEANRGFADGFGVRIRLNEASAAGDIRGDPDWLLQVVTNLVWNAAKFSPPAGEVEVAIENLSGAIVSPCETTATVFRRTSSRVFSRSLPKPTRRTPGNLAAPASGSVSSSRSSHGSAAR